MRFRTRRKSEVLDELVAKLEAMSERHPARPRLVRMVIDLRREIEPRLSQAPAGNC